MKRPGRKSQDSEQLAKSAAEFDREFVVDSFSRPTRKQSALFESARRKPGRPKEGRGAQVISVSVERGLLERSDALAKTMGISRARLVARGLTAVLAAEGLLQ